MGIVSVQASAVSSPAETLAAFAGLPGDSAGFGELVTNGLDMRTKARLRALQTSVATVEEKVVGGTGVVEDKSRVRPVGIRGEELVESKLQEGLLADGRVLGEGSRMGQEKRLAVAQAAQQLDDGGEVRYSQSQGLGELGSEEQIAARFEKRWVLSIESEPPSEEDGSLYAKLDHAALLSRPRV
jgi:hypothetical protein